jgi:hypothetical protein
LRIEDCDVLLGIFWRRFGTPATDAGSGTEHEFLRAYAAWQQHSRPQIMVYFNRRDPKLRSTADLAQYAQVLQFQERFPGEGLWWTYNGKAQFEKLVRNHLTQFLRQRGATAPTTPPAPPGHNAPVSVQQHGSGGIAIGSGAVATGAGGVAVGGHVYGDVHLGTAAAPEPTDGLQDAYLTWLMDQVRAVPLTGVDPKSIREETRRDLDLVYGPHDSTNRWKAHLRPTVKRGSSQPWPCSTRSHISPCSATQGAARVPLSTLWRCAWLENCATILTPTCACSLHLCLMMTMTRAAAARRSHSPNRGITARSCPCG